MIATVNKTQTKFSLCAHEVATFKIVRKKKMNFAPHGTFILKVEKIYQKIISNKLIG